MEQNRARRRVVGWIVVWGLALATAAWVVAVHAQERSHENGLITLTPRFEDTIGSLIVDMTIQQSMLTSGGSPTGTNPPGYTVRLERRRERNLWHTALTLLDLNGAPARSPWGPTSLPNPFIVARMEYDDDQSAPQMYDASGRLMTGPTDVDRRRLGLPDSARDPQWAPSALMGRLAGVGPGAGPRALTSGLVVAATDRQARRADLERRFGARTGQVRGLDRFVTTEGTEVHEVLVLPDSSLPAEFNVTEAGLLVRRAQFEYTPFGGDAIVRTHARGESVIPASGGARFATDIRFHGMTIVRRGER